MRAVFFLVALLVVTGCASAPSPPAVPSVLVRLSSEGEPRTSLELVDGRESAAIAGGSFTVPDEAAVFLGDQHFLPPRMSVLASSLQACCAAELAGRKAKVTDFEVSLRAVRPASDAGRPYGSVHYQNPMGPAIVGGLAGAAIATAGTTHLTCARVRIEAGTGVYSGAACGETDRADASNSIRSVVQATFDKIAAEIRSQRPK